MVALCGELFCLLLTTKTLVWHVKMGRRGGQIHSYFDHNLFEAMLGQPQTFVIISVPGIRIWPRIAAVRCGL